MASVPKTLIEAIGHLVDTDWGADPAHPLTQEIVDEMASCDLVREEVVRRLIDLSREKTDFLLGDCGASRIFGFGHAEVRPGDYGELRQKLADALAASVNQDLKQQNEHNLDAAKLAADAADEASRKSWAAERERDEWKARAERAEAALQARSVGAS